jgi:putative transposase
MKRSRFPEEQIIGILREQEAGLATADVCRKHGISGATFYKWKAKFGGMDVSEARRLKVLEDENAKLKRLLAEAMLDNAMLKVIAAKNSDARRTARSGGSPLPRAWGKPASGMFGACGGPELRPVPVVTAGRCRGPCAAAGTGGDPASVRLPAPACTAATGGDLDEPQEAATAL